MAQAQQLPEALIAQINENMTERFNYTKANETEAQKAASVVRLQKWTSDPEFQAAGKARMDADFATADANGDGLLTLEEYRTWAASLRAAAEADGVFHDPRPETIEAHFALCDQVNPATQGFSMDDFKAMTGVCMKKYLELKAADEAQ